MTGRNEVTIDSGNLVVRPKGLDVLWCFRQQITVPLQAVIEVQVMPKHCVRRGLRTLGTDIGFKICGTFQSQGRVNFWNYRKPGPVLAIQLSPGFKFSNLFLSVEYPQTVLDLIESARDGER